jgi:hypothetical protein
MSTAPPFILWWSNLEILFAPLHRSSPFIRGLRCQAIQTEHGPYLTERTPKAVYIVRCLYEMGGAVGLYTIISRLALPQNSVAQPQEAASFWWRQCRNMMHLRFRY